MSVKNNNNNHLSFSTILKPKDRNLMLANYSTYILNISKYCALSLPYMKCI